MPNKVKTTFLANFTERYGPLRRLGRSQSLYEVGEGAFRLYIRYSKIHGGNRTFYGLRETDLRQMEGFPSLICFLWDDQHEPLFIPFSEYEDVFRSTAPAGDGQYKVQVYLHGDGTELYIAQAGRFNVEGHLGWSAAEAVIDATQLETMPQLSHSQMQTFLGAIGAAKKYDVWIPPNDRTRLDWSVAGRFECCDVLPFGFESIKGILSEVDVIWLQRGSSEVRALFEVEHSTPIYSGLLRFNDIHLVAPTLRPTFSIVANETRRSLFVRQLNRPTFRVSGLNGLCTFLEYANMFRWYNRIEAQERE